MVLKLLVVTYVLSLPSLCVLTPLLLVGCVTAKVDSRLEKGVSAREADAGLLLADIQSKPQSSMSWNEAHRRMFSENLGLRQSKLSLAQAERETRRQWLSLVPRMAAFLNISTGLNILTDLDTDKLNASILGNFNIPNPFEFYASLYGAALQAQNARWSQELDERRAFAELYGAFLDAQALKAEAAAMERRKHAFTIDKSADPTKAFYAVTRELHSLERRMIAHRGNVNRLLNTPGENWNLTGTLPAVSYRDRYRDIKIGGDFGKMALKLYAVRIESSIMQTQRVKYQQWPSISFGLSNPPLYTSTGNSSFNSDDMTLFSGVNKSLDVTDIGGRQAIQDAETRLNYTREQLLLSMERETVRILQTKKSYGHLLVEKRRLDVAKKRLERPSSSEADVVMKDLAARSELELQQIQTLRQIEQLDLQILIWDERFWK